MAELTETNGPDPLFTNPQTREKILQVIRMGASLNAMFKAVGISPSTWRHWRQKALQGSQQHVEFMAAVDQAESELEVRLTSTWLDIIGIAQQTGDHKPLAEFLARRFKEDWSPSYKAEVEAKIEHTTVESEEVLRRLLPELTAGPPSGPAELPGKDS